MKPTREQRRKAKAVGQAHTVKEYMVHDALVAKGMSTIEAWKITMSQDKKARGRR